MASKEATPAASAAPAEKKAERAAASTPTYAFEFKLPKDKIGEKTTNPQVKSKVNEAFMGYGAFDECRISGAVGADRTVYVFFARLFGKGQPAWEALQKGETPTIQIYDETVNLSLTGEKPSGGGATTGTASLPKKEGKKAGKGPRKDGEAKADGKADGKADSKDSKDGKRPPRGPKREDEVKGPSLQRGRANIGGKLGPVSKIRLAKLEKEKKEKEKAEKIAAGTWVEEKKEVEEDPSAHIVAPKAKGGAKAEAGKKDAGKKEAGKKEAGKAEAGKKDAGKKEAAKKAK